MDCLGVLGARTAGINWWLEAVDLNACLHLLLLDRGHENAHDEQVHTFNSCKNDTTGQCTTTSSFDSSTCSKDASSGGTGDNGIPRVLLQDARGQSEGCIRKLKGSREGYLLSEVCDGTVTAGEEHTPHSEATCSHSTPCMLSTSTEQQRKISD